MPALEPAVWGPHFWFFLTTIALIYPHTPNEEIKRKYYDLITNLPVFLPNENISKSFAEMLQTYPVVPYLDTRADLIEWIHYIHNKVNVKLEKPEITIDQFYERYYNQYKTKAEQYAETYEWREKMIYLSLVTVSVVAIVWFNR